LVAEAVVGRPAVEVEEAVTDAGGCAAALRSRAEWAAHPQSAAVAATPLVAVEPIGTGAVAGDVITGSVVDGSAVAGGAIGGSAVAGGAVAGSAIIGGAVASGATGGNAIGGGAVAGGAVAGGAIGGGAIGGGAVGGAAEVAFSSASVGAFAGASVGAFGDVSVGSGVPVERPLTGVRVLDLTRVIAGPVCGRVLTSLGADVLCVRAPHLPTVPLLDIDTGFGKRLRLLDLREADERAAFVDLVRSVDVVVQSYRPGALERLGLGADDLAAMRPGLVHVSISAYGTTGPWAGRRGFDSLVQLATGLAHEGMLAARADRPVPLPAQVLDHATGWLAAAGVITALTRRAREGGSWRVSLSLARASQYLDEIGRTDPPTRVGSELAVGEFLAEMRSPAGMLRYVRPPGTIGGRRPAWDAPGPFA
jgi:hypothetical protein